jgi:hypothetical protein
MLIFCKVISAYSEEIGYRIIFKRVYIYIVIHIKEIEKILISNNLSIRGFSNFSCKKVTISQDIFANSSKITS